MGILDHLFGQCNVSKGKEDCKSVKKSRDRILTKFGTASSVLALVLSLMFITSYLGQAAFPGTNGQIVFQSNRDGNDEIYKMNADGSGQTRLTNNSADDQDPAWSPDGTQIAFHSTRDSNHEIYKMNTDGSGQINLTTNSAFDPHPSWSPDGSQIVFQSNRDGNQEIYVMNADGSGQTRLTNNSVDDDHPAWSPEGTKIAFRSLRDGNGEIYVMNVDGSGQTRLTNNSTNDDFPNWSPDGAQITFESNREGNSEIYTMNTDGSGQTRLTNNSAFEGFAAWSPDGLQIAFVSSRDGNLEIYVMSADGSSQTRLTNDPATDMFPDWQALEPQPLPITIDIQPGSFPNFIDPKSKGVIPVAILTTTTFDATTVDPLSVQFGPSGATEAHNQGHPEDVDGDGDQDLVLHFKTQDTGILCGDTSAILTGEIFGGQAIEGVDSISTVGCE